jgi:hypothetical protein
MTVTEIYRPFEIKIVCLENVERENFKIFENISPNSIELMLYVTVEMYP